MPYLQRENGNVVGVFANKQIGFAEEFVIEYTHIPSVAERKAAKQAEIDALETSDKCGRKYREGFLLSCEREAAAMGFTNAQAYTLNPGYRGAKDLDIVITALRAELRAIV